MYPVLLTVHFLSTVGSDECTKHFRFTPELKPHYAERICGSSSCDNTLNAGLKNACDIK